MNGINRGSIDHDMTDLLPLFKCQSGWIEVWLSGQTVTFITRCEELQTFICCCQSARHNPRWPGSLLGTFDGCKWKPTRSICHINIYQHAYNMQLYFFVMKKCTCTLAFLKCWPVHLTADIFHICFSSRVTFPCPAILCSSCWKSPGKSSWPVQNATAPHTTALYPTVAPHRIVSLLTTFTLISARLPTTAQQA